MISMMNFSLIKQTGYSFENLELKNTFIPNFTERLDTINLNQVFIAVFLFFCQKEFNGFSYLFEVLVPSRRDAKTYFYTYDPNS